MRSIKEKIAAKDLKDTYEADLVKLIFSGKILEDAKTLESYAINQESFLVVVKQTVPKTSVRTSNRPASVHHAFLSDRHLLLQLQHLAVLPAPQGLSPETRLDWMYDILLRLLLVNQLARRMWHQQHQVPLLNNSQHKLNSNLLESPHLLALHPLPDKIRSFRQKREKKHWKNWLIWASIGLNQN